MVAVTNLLSKYTILYGKVMTLVVTVQSLARRWIANYNARAKVIGFVHWASLWLLSAQKIRKFKQQSCPCETWSFNIMVLWFG